MRAFIAIALPAHIKDALANLQDQLKKSEADVKWVKPDNIHLTLKFLGEIDEKKFKAISQILEKIAAGKRPITLALTQAGAFPKLNFPRVVWVGIDSGAEGLKEMAHELDTEIAKCGLPKDDRPFTAHLTVGRLRSHLKRDKLIKILQDMACGHKLEEKFTVTKITLFQSTLTPSGPIYQVLKEANLKTT